MINLIDTAEKIKEPFNRITNIDFVTDWLLLHQGIYYTLIGLEKKENCSGCQVFGRSCSKNYLVSDDLSKNYLLSCRQLKAIKCTDQKIILAHLFNKKVLKLVKYVGE